MGEQMREMQVLQEGEGHVSARRGEAGDVRAMCGQASRRVMCVQAGGRAGDVRGCVGADVRGCDMRAWDVRVRAGGQARRGQGRAR